MQRANRKILKNLSKKKKVLLIFLTISLIILTILLVIYINSNKETEDIAQEEQTNSDVDEEPFDYPAFFGYDDTQYPRVSFDVRGSGNSGRISIEIPEGSEVRFSEEALDLVRLHWSESTLGFSFPYRDMSTTYTEYEKVEHPSLDMYRVKIEHDERFFYTNDLKTEEECISNFGSYPVDPPCGNNGLRPIAEPRTMPFVAIFDGPEVDIPTSDKIMESLIILE